MDVITHTVMAGLVMGGCYIWGRYLAYHDFVEDVVDKTLLKLEDEGFVRTEIDEDGDKSLIPISEIEANLVLDK